MNSDLYKLKKINDILRNKTSYRFKENQLHYLNNEIYKNDKHLFLKKVKKYYIDKVFNFNRNKKKKEKNKRRKSKRKRDKTKAKKNEVPSKKDINKPKNKKETVKINSKEIELKRQQRKQRRNKIKQEIEKNKKEIKLKSKILQQIINSYKTKSNEKIYQPIQDLFEFSKANVKYESKEMINHVKNFNEIMKSFIVNLKEKNNDFMKDIIKYIDPVIISISHNLNVFYQHLEYNKNITEYLQWLLNCIIHLCETLKRLSFHLCKEDNKETSISKLNKCIYHSFQTLCDDKLYQKLKHSYSKYTGKNPLVELMIKDSFLLLQKKINDYIKQKIDNDLSELKFVTDNIDHFIYPVNTLYTNSSEYKVEKSQSSEFKIKHFKQQHFQKENEENEVMEDHFEIRKTIINFFIENEDDLEEELTNYDIKKYEFTKNQNHFFIIIYFNSFYIKLTIHNDKSYDDQVIDSKKKHNKIHIQVIDEQQNSLFYIKYLLQYDKKNNIILHKNVTISQSQEIKYAATNQIINILETYLNNGLEQYNEYIEKVNKYMNSKNTTKINTKGKYRLLDKILKLKQDIKNNLNNGKMFTYIIKKKIINNEEIEVPSEYKEVYSFIYKIIEKKKGITKNITKLQKQFKLNKEPIDIFNNLLGINSKKN